MSTGWSSEWLDFAYMDLSAAEHLLTMRPLPVEIICYHCEQAAEKFLKATLVQFDRCCFANKLRKIFIQSAKKKRRLKGF